MFICRCSITPSKGAVIRVRSIFNSVRRNCARAASNRALARAMAVCDCKPCSLSLRLPSYSILASIRAALASTTDAERSSIASSQRSAPRFTVSPLSKGLLTTLPADSAFTSTERLLSVRPRNTKIRVRSSACETRARTRVIGVSSDEPTLELCSARVWWLVISDSPNSKPDNSQTNKEPAIKDAVIKFFRIDWNQRKALERFKL